MTSLRARLILLALVGTSLTGCAIGTSAPPPPGVSFPTGDEAAPATAGTAGAPEGDRDVVERVVDGDTVVLANLGTVRLVGVDTPETVKPDTPVQCHGPQASRAAKDTLTGRDVIVESDPVAGTRDRYDRRLGYLWYLDGSDGWRLYNLEAIEAGDARAYAYDNQPYRYRTEFENAERRARDAGLGLWRCPAE